MEITELVEKNSTLLRLGLHLEFNDARHRVAAHLQRNIDRSEYSNSILFNILLDNFKRYLFVADYTREFLIKQNNSRRKFHKLIVISFRDKEKDYN